MTATEPAADDLRTPEQWERFVAARHRILSFKEFTALERARRGERAPNGPRTRRPLKVVVLDTKGEPADVGDWT